MELEKEEAQKTGQAMILGIGTANPPNCFYQIDYPNYYLQVTKSHHMSDLKAKIKTLCKILKPNPNIAAKMTPSLDTLLDMEITEVPKLDAEAAILKAIKDWGQPKSSITHLVFHSTLGTLMPGLDHQLINLLGLDPSVKRFMLYHLGCYGGGTVLRLAKDLAENNNGARVLVVCSKVMVNAFRGPSHAHLNILVGHAIFGDGAAIVIVGTNPNILSERLFFEIVSVNQTTLPKLDDAMGGRLREVGLIYYLSKKLSSIVANNIKKCLVEALSF
ncbi:Chalcone synthase 4 [Camellia lanceoleosa]|uniref:Chalcone synthase 4 n=1 Tax=Camellia lanceoleosa TaxID=1840588 RepID=A0ACC0GK63_9ERIC|nr:Chalcone synthase 4 [Camellia lanceoleosa]